MFNILHIFLAACPRGVKRTDKLQNTLEKCPELPQEPREETRWGWRVHKQTGNGINRLICKTHYMLC